MFNWCYEQEPHLTLDFAPFVSNQTKSKSKEHSEESDSEEDPAKLQKQRDWDEWKDGKQVYDLCCFKWNIIIIIVLSLKTTEMVQERKMYLWIFNLYGYHQRTKHWFPPVHQVKPCWTGLLSGWVTIWIKYPVLYFLGSQAGVVNINHVFYLYYKYCMWIEFQSISTWLRFPPSTKINS